ncbi:MAG: N-acetyltransferase [candidate division Zixibacteria bacterium]|nr:N-acetyltransferase [candidate division Zixibacteria bacterium]
MTNIKIVEVESSSQLGDFIDYPNELYRDDPNYVVPLKSERLEFFNKKKNPFYRVAKTKLFLATDVGRMVGRIATCVDYAYNEYHSEQTGFFGFFECEDNFEVASQLLKVAMIELKREGMESMRGPMNFSTNHECGFLIEGFDSPPIVMMTYNKPYLPRLTEKFGLKKAMDLVAYRLDKETPIPDRIQSVVNRQQQRSGITIRSIDMKNFNRDVQLIRDVYNQAWEDNWGFVPLSSDEFDYIARNLRQVIEPELVLIAEYAGKPIAFLMALPDINQALIHLNGKLFPLGLFKILWHTRIRNKIDTLRVVTMGVVPQFRKRGVDSMLYINCYNRGVEKGYVRAELSWVLETNKLMRSALDRMGAEQYKRYRIVSMPL